MFYSIIGEGEWTGCPAFFIRLAGCNLSCSFCDTNYKEQTYKSPEELLNHALRYPTRKVVITGGEPTIHKLKPLTSTFRKEFKIHLETNGLIKPDSFDLDWVAVSPKGVYEIPMMGYASEVKFLCGIPDWKEILEYWLLKTPGIKWLLPVASGNELVKENIDLAVNYCLSNPQVKLCIQVHKVIGVK